MKIRCFINEDGGYRLDTESLAENIRAIQSDVIRATAGKATQGYDISRDMARDEDSRELRQMAAARALEAKAIEKEILSLLPEE